MRNAWFPVCVLFVFGWSIVLAEEGNGEDYSCRRAMKTITVDGDMSDWVDQRPLPLMLVGAENVAIPSWKGPDDCSAIVYLMWDDANLYFAAKVTDDVHHHPDSGHGMYNGDCFQIAFDPLDDSLIPGYDGNDMEIGIGDTKAGPVIYAWVGGQSGVSGIVPKELAKVAYKPAQDGKSGVFEAAISWKMFKSVVPTKGRHMGFNIIYNDNDGGPDGRRGWLMWTPGIAEEKLSFTFRNIVLTGSTDGRAKPLLPTDRKYYDDGQPVKFACYIPGDKAGKSSGTAELTVKSGEQIVFRDTKKFEVLPDVNRVDFVYPMQKAPVKPLDCAAEICVAGVGEPIVLRTQVLGLNVPLLKKRADEIAARNKSLRELISQAEKKGLEMTYPRVTAATVDVHLKFRLQDLDNKELVDRNHPLAEINRQFNYLDEAMVRATREVQELSAHPDRIRVVPKVEMTDLVIKNGTFYKGDQPVMLFGPSGWWTVWSDLGLIRELGFNLVSGTMTPDGVVPAPGEVQTSGVQAVADQLSWARGQNMAVDYLPSPHPIPAGWVKAFPDVKDFSGNGWMGASLYNPHVRRMVEEFWNALVPYVCDKPALAMWDVINEWSFSDGVGKVHPLMLVRFQNHLRERYGTVEALNRAWKSDYRSFEAIDPLKFDREKTVGAFYDWESFRNAEATEVMAFMKNIIRRYDSKTPCHVKVIATTDLNPEHFGSNGIEREAIDDVLEISGCDCGSSIHFDFYKSLHPSKPSIDSEVHTGALMTPEEMRTSIWDAFLHGQSARVMWAWENSHTAEHMAAGAILHLPWSLEAAGRTSLDVQRLAREITVFQQAIPNSQVAIVFSQASMILDKDYPPALRTMHSSLFFLDTPVRFISERQIRDGGLAGVRVLIVPGARFVTDETCARIVKFARAGGKVYMSAGSLSRDPYNNVRPEKELADAGVKMFDPGSGKTAELFDAVFDDAKVNRPVRLIGADNSKAPSVEFRAVDQGNATLAYVINHGEGLKVTLKSGRKITRVLELISGKELTLPFMAERKDPMLLRIE